MAKNSLRKGTISSANFPALCASASLTTLLRISSFWRTSATTFLKIHILAFSPFHWRTWLIISIVPNCAFAQFFSKRVLKPCLCEESMRISLRCYLGLAEITRAFFRRRFFWFWSCCHFKLTCSLHELIKHIIFHDCFIQKL